MEILDLKNNNDNYNKIKEAAKIIKQGGLVLFPTETVYGLGADGLKEDGKIAQAKGVTSQRAALLEVVTGASDFAVVDVLMANSMVGKGDFAVLAKASIELEGEVYAIGFKKGSALTAEVNAELIKLAESGKTQEIAKKYKLENSVITDYSSQK